MENSWGRARREEWGNLAVNLTKNKMDVARDEQREKV
jgi:hypothetical protein